MGLISLRLFAGKALLILTGSIFWYLSPAAAINGSKFSAGAETDSIQYYYERLRSALESDRMDISASHAACLKRLLVSPAGKSGRDLSGPFYMIAIYHTKNNEPFMAFPWFDKARRELERYPSDNLSGRIYYNLGVSYNKIGDHPRSEKHFLQSLEYVKRTQGSRTPELAYDYLSLSISNIEVRDYMKAIEFADLGIDIASESASVAAAIKALLYQTKGTALSQISDYYPAIRNLMRAMKIYQDNQLPRSEEYINLLDNIAAAYYMTGDKEKAEEIYRGGVDEFTSQGTYAAFSLARNYADFLGVMNKKAAGEDILEYALERLGNNPGTGSREYSAALSSYAEYLLENEISFDRPLEIFHGLFDYSVKNPWDKNLNTLISLGYARSLAMTGNPITALDSINSILRRDSGSKGPVRALDNPDDSLLKHDKRTLDILKAKYSVLISLTGADSDIRVLQSLARSAEQIVRIIEYIRLNIGEEQSRLLLGDNYRDAYLNVISSFFRLYLISGLQEYLERAIEYTEKSKAASLLASVREMKAMRHFIPAGLIAAERKAFGDVSYYSARLDEETNSPDPDQELIGLWERSLYSAEATRDSLRKVFEKQYAGYYELKYNPIAVNARSIRKAAGRDKDYLSYVVSDSLLYTVLVNRKLMHLEAIKIDDDFRRMVTEYRRLISEPDRDSRAREEFIKIQEYGFRLYSVLIEPVKKLFISDKLIISPDNLLAFFPFETLVTSQVLHDDLYYSRLSYLMNDYRISYAYSAALLLESGEARREFRKRTAAFAPSYDRHIHADSLSENRQMSDGFLTELKFAAEEAEFVSDITRGELYSGMNATKAAYAGLAPHFDILHLAMHTVLNSRDPLSSGMIFAGPSDSSDIYLRPYEIYAIPLDASMVVLSSCYTGAGDLYSGEGVLSLARGFIYSGSKSVVMSLWEVDDRAGTDIIKAFYSGLRSGKEKSSALRKARIDYLRKADMLRSHPYFWSTLVIYGDDSPLYVSGFEKALVALIAVLLGLYIFSYLRKR